MKVILNSANISPNISSSVSAIESKQKPDESLGNLDRLSVLEKKLSGAQSMLKYCNREDADVLDLEFKIGDLLESVKYLQGSFSLDQIGGKKGSIAERSLLPDSILLPMIADYENKAGAITANLHRTLGVEPLGRDIVISARKAKLPKPFEISDKLLNLDEYQKEAVKEFKNGNTVMVTAPTGTGKTLIAEHIIDELLKSGKKVIYTTPLKALCNDKYKQFRELWGDYNSRGQLIGSSKVGIATGDIKKNVKAPLVIMTTEIYRNMLVQQGEKDAEKELKDVDAVIFDEFHYMGDEQRGSVWEESVMFSPKRMKFLMLSATIANAKPLRDWVTSINDDHNAVVIDVPEEERHVPLKHFVYSDVDKVYDFRNLISDKVDINVLKHKKLSKREQETLSEISQKIGAKDGIEALEIIFSQMENNPERVDSQTFIRELLKRDIPYSKAEQYALRLANKDSAKMNPVLNKMSDTRYIRLDDIINRMNRKNMLPALYFTYSKKNCKKLMQEAASFPNELLTAKEKQEIKKKIDEVQSKGIFLGVDFDEKIRPCLLRGVAMHHAGMLPQCKSLIEELGRNKLIKICFATDTLGAGINFPFKTVVFSAFEKYGDYGFDEISTNTFKQGAGRAGRRGIDDIGYVISIPKNREELIMPFNKVTQPSDEVQSAFKLSYGLILSPRFLNNSLEVLQNSFDTFQRKNCDFNYRQSKKMQEILKERGFIESKNNKFIMTPKGRIASKIRGMNEILLTEIITDSTIIENIDPSGLAGLISAFAPDKEEKAIAVQDLINNKYDKKVWLAIELAKRIKCAEAEKNIESNISINALSAPLVKMWADVENNANSALMWTGIVNTAMSNNVVKTEGDFLKKVNFTVNMLKQIEKVAPNQHLKEVARKAIKMLQKSPVNDILLYELDYKEDNE